MIKADTCARGRHMSVHSNRSVALFGGIRAFHKYVMEVDKSREGNWEIATFLACSKLAMQFWLSQLKTVREGIGIACSVSGSVIALVI
jgi:hypothetical protein